MSWNKKISRKRTAILFFAVVLLLIMSVFILLKIKTNSVRNDLSSRISLIEMLLELSNSAKEEEYGSPDCLDSCLGFYKIYAEDRSYEEIIDKVELENFTIQNRDYENKTLLLTLDENEIYTTLTVDVSKKQLQVNAYHEKFFGF